MAHEVDDDAARKRELEIENGQPVEAEEDDEEAGKAETITGHEPHPTTQAAPDTETREVDPGVVGEATVDVDVDAEKLAELREEVGEE